MWSLLRVLRALALGCVVSLGLHAQAPATRLQARVWVNTGSGVYHCPDSRYYGKTKAGEYMSEAQARGSGYRANGGKACSADAPTTAAPIPLATTEATGKVWVNTSSGVYHCPGSEYFGKTKRGAYMTEAAAIDAGHRAAGSRRCQP